MKLKLTECPLGRELTRLFPDSFSLRSGTICRWKRGGNEGYSISLAKDEILITHSDTDDLVMALGELMTYGLAARQSKIPPYRFRGIMLDVSRNAVVRTDFLKERIAKLALMGLNRFCLYTEDTFTVPGEPLFGYARGRYSSAEIRDLVKYGRIFGVTLFPCIQTLGHMEHILKYPHYTPLKDNDAVYNVYADGLYDFIEKTIDAARAPYDTDLIHVGMDETFGLGRGLAFKEMEGINPRKLYVDHVRKVTEICRKKGLKPIMWGDIVLGTTCEARMQGEEARRLPKDVAMNYWEYAYCDVEKYSRDLADFKNMGYDPMVSPGVWCWSRFFPAYYKAESNISTLLESGKRNGVRSALNTHWGDDGHECFFDYNLPAHTYFLAQCTEVSEVLSHAKRKFAAVFQFDYDAVRSVEKIDTAGYKVESLLPYNVGKCFFYEDPAQGLFSGASKVRPAAGFYRELAKEMAVHSRAQSPFQPLFRFAESFCDFLSVKSDLRRNLVAAYRKKDKKAMKRQLEEIASASRKLAKTRKLYREYWLKERSPFGLEVIEGRMGAVAARLDYLAHIVGEHLSGALPRLEEFEFKHYSMFHQSRNPDYHPSVWPEYMLHYSALASRNTIKWW